MTEPEPQPLRVKRVLVLTLLCLAAPPLKAQRTPQDSARALPGIVATGQRELCRSRDDPAARAAWERMRARHGAALDGMSLWAEMRVSAGWVDRRSLFRFDTLASERADGTTDGWNLSEVRRDAQRRLLAFYDVPRVGAGHRGMSASLRALLEMGIERHGYGERNMGLYADLTQLSEAWNYPPLDAELAPYFASPAFAARVALRVERREPLTLGFCTLGRHRAAPWISGTLTLRADTTLERAQWQFHTPEPAEEAGGDVWFRDGTLEPSMSIFWRRSGNDRFFQRRMTFDRWRAVAQPLLPDSAAPAERPRLPVGGRRSR